MEMTDEQTFLQDIKEELENAPPIFYKYCSIKKATTILQDSAITLSSPRDFNDPFDTYFRMLPPSEEDLRAWVNQKTPKPVKRMEMRNKVRRKSKFHKGKIPHEVQHSIDKMGISCFSETSESILMWAHYADSHSGVCLGFDGVPIRQFILEPYMQEMRRYNARPEQILHLVPKAKWRMLCKVHYVDDLPIFKIASSDISRANHIRKKSSIWSYEKEWRIIAPDGGAGQVMGFPKEILAEIIFGVKATGESIEKVRKLAVDKGYSAKFIQAKQSATKYEIEFAPCPD